MIVTRDTPVRSAQTSSAQSLYLLATYGNGNGANVYEGQYTLSLGKDGSLTVNGGTAPVPLPAAVWLFGSGLMGLLGICRRRTAIAPVAA